MGWMQAAYKFELVKAWWYYNSWERGIRILQNEVVEAIYKGEDHPFIYKGNESLIATTNPYDGRRKPKEFFRYERALFPLWDRPLKRDKDKYPGVILEGEHEYVKHGGWEMWAGYPAEPGIHEGIGLNLRELDYPDLDLSKVDRMEYLQDVYPGLVTQDDEDKWSKFETAMEPFATALTKRLGEPEWKLKSVYR